MTLFIQSDVGGDGTGTVFPNQAEGDLFIISNQDMALGEQTQPPPSDLIQVTYGNQNQHGPCPDRLHTLVNTSFNQVPGDPVDIIILAVDGSFTLNDGTSMKNNGTALGWQGSGLPGASNNPTNSVLVIYDGISTGVCEKGKASHQFDLGIPSPVALYHELSHAFRLAQLANLSLAASGCDASPEEHAAEVDENDMRTQLGGPLRDDNDHCGQACNASPSCCIVASVATGSYSDELTTLRQLRDGFLRCSEVGFDFFERLHYDYYSFSPEVCSAMAGDAELVRDIADYYVRPLTAYLRLARARLIEGTSSRELGHRFTATIPEELKAAPAKAVTAALAMLTGRAGDARPSRPPHLPKMPMLAVSSPYVRWALVDTITIYLSTLVEQKRDDSAAELGRALARRLDRWSSALPITPIWSDFSDYEFAQELAILGSSLLRSKLARKQFGRRLLHAHGDDTRIAELLTASRYLDRDRS